MRKGVTDYMTFITEAKLCALSQRPRGRAVVKMNRVVGHLSPDPACLAALVSGLHPVFLSAPLQWLLVASPHRTREMKLKLCGAAMTIVIGASCRRWRASAVVMAPQKQAKARHLLQMLQVMISRTQQDSAVLTTQVAQVVQAAAKYGTPWPW